MKKKVLVVVAVILALAVLGVGVWHYLWFEAQIPYFDQGGWFVSGEGETYFLDYFGAPMTGWLEHDGNRYYLDPENGGEKATGWVEVDGGRFYLDDSGVQQEGFLMLGEDVYYLPPDGAVNSGWTQVQGEVYYLSVDGVVHTGWLTLEEGTYFLNEDGTKTFGKAEIGENLYYFDENGLIYCGWLAEGDTKVYFTEEGLHTGWLTLEDGTYYLGQNGNPVSGWNQIGEDRYCFDDEGRMVTGWVTEGEDLYYLRQDGTMAVGHVVIDGVDRFFDSKGKAFYLVNRKYAVPQDAVPEIVYVEGWPVDAKCAAALKQMIIDCRLAGYVCNINSAYRDYNFQKQLFDARTNTYIAEGYSRQEAQNLAATRVLPPGTSEHQLGLAVDITGNEAMYSWLEKYAPDYGFILRYPDDKIDITGIIYEPWHFRYLGVELAAEISELGITLEEYVQMLTKD